MEKIIGETRYIFKVGKIEEEEVDALFLWTTQSLDAGDLTFLRIHREAGSVLAEQTIKAKMKFGVETKEGQIIPPGRAIITYAGRLNCYNIIHCVLPNYRITKLKKEERIVYLENTLLNSFQLAKSYSDSSKDMSSSITLNSASIQPIPSVIYGNLDKQDYITFFSYIIKNSPFKKIIFVFETDEERKIYEDIFFKLTTSLYERIINKIFKLNF